MRCQRCGHGLVEPAHILLSCGQGIQVDHGPSEYAGLVLFGHACETFSMVEEVDGWDSGRPGSEYAGLVLFGCARETCATVEQVDGWVWNV